MSNSVIRWGIIGPGRIARKFADDLRLVPDARLHAVASSDLGRARDFARQYDAPFAFGDYRSIARCPDLDVVYVATPHVAHAEGALLVMEEGISVLVEKPFAMHAGEARRMVDAARRNRVFLMEALWTRFIPSMQYATELVQSGAIGTLHTIQSDFGFLAPYQPASRLFNKALGGGALLDIGIYPVLLALGFFGRPAREDIQAVAAFTPTDVDASCAFAFQYPGNRLALGHATIAAHTPLEAWLYGTEGHIRLHSRWHHSRQVTLTRYEGTSQHAETRELPYEGWGYHFEAAHVVQCLQMGLLESDIAPLDFTLDLCGTLDDIRAHVGLVY